MSGDLQVELLNPLTMSGVPRYRQIADQLSQLISDVAPGTRLPSEHKLANYLDVSRSTSVQALRELEVRGLVNRRPGRGTFVADMSRVVRSGGAGFVPSFSRDLRGAGHDVHEIILDCDRRLPTDSAATSLEIADDRKAWCVRRVIHSDGDPAVHVTSYLPVWLYPRMEQAAIESSSLYEYLEAEYGKQGHPSNVEEEWSAGGVDRDVAAALDLRTGAPVMRVKRLASLADGTPSEYAISSVRAEVFVVSVRATSDDRPNVPTTWVRAAGL